MALNFPLIAWGDADEVGGAGWTVSGTPIRTPGQADPFGGTAAVLIEDDNAAGFEGYERPGGVAVNGRLLVTIAIKEGTSTGPRIQIANVSGGANVGNFIATFVGGVPTFTTPVGVWSALAAASIGGGWWGVLGVLTGLTDGVPVKLQFYPAGGGSASVGSTAVYLRNFVLLDVPQGPPKAWPALREGSEKVRGPDGGYDTWKVGRDYLFEGELPWIPSVPRSSPVLVSGWEGLNEAVGVNCGVQAMLEAGWDAQSLIFVPDRNDCATNIPSELVKPWMEDEPSTKRNGDRSILLRLRNPTKPYPLSI